MCACVCLRVPVCTCVTGEPGSCCWCCQGPGLAGASNITAQVCGWVGVGVLCERGGGRLLGESGLRVFYCLVFLGGVGVRVGGVEIGRDCCCFSWGVCCRVLPCGTERPQPDMHGAALTDGPSCVGLSCCCRCCRFGPEIHANACVIQLLTGYSSKAA